MSTHHASTLQVVRAIVCVEAMLITGLAGALCSGWLSGSNDSAWSLSSVMTRTINRLNSSGPMVQHGCINTVVYVAAQPASAAVTSGHIA